MKRNRFIIIGLGSIGRELLKKISRDFNISCIDIDPDTVETAKEIRADCNVITGDATSRLVLEGAGVTDADGIIIATTEEKVNLEVARVLQEHFSPKRIIAVGTTKTGIDTLTALGVEVENVFTASAISIRNRLEQASRAAHAIGLGKEEILEVEVHPHSRFANRPVRTLTPLRWRIGIIYRDDNIVVPKRDSVLKPKDRVVILGDPGILKTVSEIFAFSFQRFPLEYGSTMIVYIKGDEDEIFFSEIKYVLSVFPLNKTVFVFSKKAEKRSGFYEEIIIRENITGPDILKPRLPAYGAIEQAVNEAMGDQGLLVIGKDRPGRGFFTLRSGIKGKQFINSLVHMAKCPLLLCAGTFPYEKTVVPCVEQINLQHTLETSLEIATSLNNEVTVLLIKPSRYISSGDDLSLFEEMKETVNETSSMYKLSVNKKFLEGNPVKSVMSVLNEYNLLMTDIRGWKRQRWFTSFLNPDVIWHIIRDAETSTMLLPLVEEFL